MTPIKEPPHQNSVLLGPCKKIAANQGHWPDGASTPPTILPAEYSCWPHSAGSMKLPIWLSSALDMAPMAELTPVLGIVKTGTSGRWVVEVVVRYVTGFSTKLGLVVSLKGLWVVSCVLSDDGQQTPGTNKLLKHKDSLRWVRSRSSPGQLLRSSHFPGRPSGVRHRFSPSLPWTSNILA